MSTLVAFATKHGSTQKIAKLISDILEDETTIINVKKQPDIDISIFETIIIGSPVYYGQIQKEIKRFCDRNENILMRKQLGIYICGMGEADMQPQFESLFQKPLLDRAKAKVFLLGEYDFSKLNFIEKFIVKKVAKVNKSLSKIDVDAIQDFAGKFND